MNEHIFWWNRLSHKQKHNFSINYIYHYEDLRDFDILEIYEKQKPSTHELMDKYKYLLETQQKCHEYFKKNNKYKGKASAKGKIEILELIINDLK